MRTAEEFWAHTDKQSNGCVYWTGSRDSNGYGTLKWRDRYDRAHRVAFELSRCKRPSRGLYICHRCDVPYCVNPKHLFQGTALANMRDAKRKGRLKQTEVSIELNSERRRDEWARSPERKKVQSLHFRRRASLRKKVFQRDRGICCDCGIDTENLRLRLRGISILRREAYIAAWRVLEDQGFIKQRSLWESDHALALDEGGLDELENLVTRCRPCHRDKTSEQAKRKARLRKTVGRKFLETRKARRLMLDELRDGLPPKRVWRKSS